MRSPASLRRLLACCWLALAPALAAQSPATGSIQGRVFDPARGEYLETARVTIEGTSLEAFTDAGGHYRLVNVPAGSAKVKVFFTGLAARTDVVAVVAGQTTTHDFTLTASGGRAGTTDDVIQLSAFVVGASREMDGAAIAINEQRFARNIVNVVASDEFGLVVDGTPGEVMKFLPGITMDYSAGEARTVSMNGVPAANVPITVGGFSLASAASNGTGRVTNLDQFSVNSIARIEVHHSPTPESPGSALAGSVNMVPRSAFERSKPSYSYSGFIMMKDGDRHFNKTAGPLDEPMRKVTPGWNFSAVVPVNSRFGFTLSGNYADQYSYEDVITLSWRGVGAVTTVAATATNGLPDTTPDKPYLTDVALRDSTRDNRTASMGFTADYRLTPRDTLSASYQYTFIGVKHNNRTFSFFVNRVLPGDWGPTFTRGAPGGYGEVRVQGSAQDWYGTTDTLSLVWRHNGPLWKFDAGAGYSGAGLHVRDVDKGWFGASQARRTGVNIAFADIFYLRPNTITVTDNAGNPVDPYNLNNYSLVSADDHPRETYDDRRSANASLRRDFTIREVPVSIKVGADIKSNARDLRGQTIPYNYWGPDRVASTTPVGSDDAAGRVLDVAFSQRVGAYGFPRIQWIDNNRYYDLYRTNPEYFQPYTASASDPLTFRNAADANQNSIYRNAVGLSKFAREIISSAYLRLDAAFFNRRLQFVGGLRAEQTNIRAEGPLTDNTRNYLRDAAGNIVPQRDAAGNILLNASGRPLPALIQTSTIAVPGGTLNNANAVSRLTYIDRGQHVAKEYLRLLPSLNVSYHLRDNLILRGAAYQSLGRPSFDQYAGGITLPDTQSAPASNNRISVNNAAIKAWSANTVKFRLEYYFEKVGNVAVSAYRRDFKNFFGNTVFNVTPELLALYDLDPSVYDPYDVSTQYNLSSRVRMEGIDFEYKQALTFLPGWARGLQTFANASAIRATGDGAANFAGFIPRNYSWGVSLSRPKYNVKMSWNYRGAQRRGIVSSGRGIEPNTYNWGSKRLYIDLTADYQLTRRIWVFMNMRNIGDATEDSKIYNPLTPAYARFRQRVDYGSAWTFGFRGSL
jgi:TonB-dependent receptor